MASGKKNSPAPLDKAMAAISAGKSDIAVYWLKTWVAQNPANRADLRGAASQAAAAASWQTAVILSRALTQIDPSPENRVVLARAALRSGNRAEASSVCRQILEDPAAAARAVADASVLCAEAGDVETALAAFRKHPADSLDPAYAVALSTALWSTDPALADETTTAALARLRGPRDANADTWAAAFRLVEWRDRHRRGLSTANVGSAAEVEFTAARPLAEAMHAAASALPMGVDPKDDARAYVFAIGANDFGAAHRAQRLLAALPNNPSAAVHLDNAFLAGAADWDSAPLLATLAPVEELQTSAPAAHTFLLACDCGYLKSFGAPLLRSIAHVSPGTSVHVHLFSDAPDEAAGAVALIRAAPSLNLRITVEYSGRSRYFTARGDRKDYYHAARFIRFHQFLETAPGAVWIMDVDALANRDVAGAVATFGAADIGLRARPGRAEPWNRFSACLVAARPSATGRTYARMTACYLARIMERDELRWGADQVALYAAYRAMEENPPSFVFWPESIADIYAGDESVFWFIGGGAVKQFHLTNTGAPASAYEALFRTYRT